jgi:hypothetical protein
VGKLAFGSLAAGTGVAPATLWHLPGRVGRPGPSKGRPASVHLGASRYLYGRLQPGRPARSREVSMNHDSRITSFVLEMVGSAAICGFAYAAEILVGIRRRRATA